MCHLMGREIAIPLTWETTFQPYVPYDLVTRYRNSKAWLVIRCSYLGPLKNDKDCTDF